jgi:hypothetical protein
MKLNTNKEESKWCSPAHGTMMLNKDGAIDLSRGIAGAGIVVRNNVGEFLAAACRRYNYVDDPFTIELLACRDAMLVAVQTKLYEGCS